MPFAVAQVITKLGKKMFADRIRTSPGTYTVSPKFAGMGVGATAATRTAAVTDTVLSTEVETRTSGAESVVTTTDSNDTYQLVATIAATAGRAVDEVALFDASSVGNMFFSATQNVINLLTGDSIAFTLQAQVT